MTMRFGILLPHTGLAASRDRIIGQSRRAETLGYDSVWVRDHLVWHPHGMEGTDLTFVEPLLSLAAIAAVTECITLGTAVLIPIRWPLKLAQNLATLSFLAGPRLIAGIGMGFNPPEFAATGFEYEQRAQITKEIVEICQRMWTEEDVSYQGEIFQFEHITLKPQPTGHIPFWYGGSTRASVRRAVDYCEGWLPGRIPLATLDNRLALLRKLSAEAGKVVHPGAIPLIKIDHTREKARRGVDVDALAGSSEGARHWIKPPSGAFETIEDLAGTLICGDPDECIEQIREFEKRGIEELILDFRLQWDQFEEMLGLVAERVLPAFRPTER